MNFKISFLQTEKNDGIECYRMSELRSLVHYKIFFDDFALNLDADDDQNMRIMYLTELWCINVIYLAVLNIG